VHEDIGASGWLLPVLMMAGLAYMSVVADACSLLCNKIPAWICACARVCCAQAWPVRVVELIDCVCSLQSLD
jgi:hypothetical protein